MSPALHTLWVVPRPSAPMTRGDPDPKPGGPQPSALLHASALHLLPPSVCDGERWHIPAGHPVSARAGTGRAPFLATCWLPSAIRFPETLTPQWLLGFGHTFCPTRLRAQHPSERGLSVPTVGRTHPHRFDAGQAVNSAQRRIQTRHPGHLRNHIETGTKCATVECCCPPGDSWPARTSPAPPSSVHFS